MNDDTKRWIANLEARMRVLQQLREDGKLTAENKQELDELRDLFNG